VQGFIERTIYNIIKLYELGLPFEKLPRNGRRTSFDKKNLKCLQNAAANRVGVSQRKLTRKFGVAQSIIHCNLYMEISK
jgi:hypothetical protein